MELVLKREIRTNNSTIGKLSVDGAYQCDILEDVDRGLLSNMTVAELIKLKVKHETCIPAGRYQVVLAWSPKHNAAVPHVVNVPAYDAIEIHPGNTKADTDGCLLPGEHTAPDFVANSRAAYALLLKKLIPAFKTGKVFLTII